MIFALSLALAADGGVPVTGHAGAASTLGAGHVIFGVFRPVSVGVSDKVDLSTSGLATLVAPRAEIKVNLMDEAAGAVAITGGLGFPTPGLSLLRGTVLSSDPTATLGFGTVARAGVVGTLKSRGATRTSLGVEVRAGTITGGMGPVDLPFVGQSLAPLLEGPVLRWRWVTDYALSNRCTFTTDLGLQLGAGGPDALARAMLLGGSDHVAVGAGWALADEELQWGRDSLGFPLVDLQARW